MYYIQKKYEPWGGGEFSYRFPFKYNNFQKHQLSDYNYQTGLNKNVFYCSLFLFFVHLKLNLNKR
jgi:hypothetical protein